ncbi:hypothetical protein, partial [Thauera sedimentorum]|uniref:hypothetical protein n=1 Tax=Thauera sedimentorum TaxID=2767595 RepID=UPI001CA739F7
KPLKNRLNTDFRSTPAQHRCAVQRERGAHYRHHEKTVNALNEEFQQATDNTAPHRTERASESRTKGADLADGALFPSLQCAQIKEPDRP